MASRSSRPLSPVHCSTRRATRLSSQLSLSAVGLSRFENTRPRVRTRYLRPRRASEHSKCQLTSGGNYDRGTESLRATVFTQTDPMPYGVGHPYESSYVYGFNNPNVFVDPSGLRGQVAGGLPSECFGMEARQIALDSIQAGSNLPGSVANGFISIGNWVNPFTDIPNVPKIRIDGACDIVSDLATGSVTFAASGGTKAIMAAPKIITGGAGAAKAAVALARNARAQSSAIYEISLAAKDIRHALKNHFVVKAGKSLFAPDANFLQLVRDAERVKPVTQTMNPNLIRVVKAAKAVGTEASTGQMTNVYTVVTRADGSLVTMYPGRP